MAVEIWYNDHISLEWRISQAWINQHAAPAGPKLPEHIKVAVLALVRSIPGKEQSV
jgi:hypothetical protein